MYKRVLPFIFVLLITLLGYYIVRLYLVKSSVSKPIPLSEMKLYAAVEKRGTAEVLAFRNENNSNKLVRELSHSVLSTAGGASYKIVAFGWNDAHTEFWGVLNYTSLKPAIVFNVLPTDNFKVESYATEELFGTLPDEIAINPEKQAIAYSEGQNLNIFFMESREKKLVATNEGGFKPIWVNTTTLEYNNPSEEERSTFSL